MPVISNSIFIALIVMVISMVVIIIVIAKQKKTGGKTYSATSTPFLNLYTSDFTKLAEEGRLDPVIGREEEVRHLTQVLSRRGKNNAILIGEPGVGKTAIVEGLAQRIVQKAVPDALQNKRVLALDVATLLSGTKYRGEFEERAKKIVKEIAAAGRSIILFIDEVQSVVQSQGSEGSINFSDILKPALARGDLQMVGATTVLEYEKYFKTDPSLERRFQPIEVKEPSQAETLTILQGIKDQYREYHKVEFTDAALETAVKLSDALVKDRKLPDKAIDALDEAAAMVKVAHVRTALNSVLYHVATEVNPEVSQLWKSIQSSDTKFTGVASPTEKKEFIKQREAAEAELEKKGIITVDAADVEKIIKEWI